MHCFVVLHFQWLLIGNPYLDSQPSRYLHPDRVGEVKGALDRANDEIRRLKALPLDPPPDPPGETKPDRGTVERFQGILLQFDRDRNDRIDDGAEAREFNRHAEHCLGAYGKGR